ncbi:odorant receptor 85c [Leptinotarsa decemlineata]|uniref:odorant receptor 85c n=1 Tax=Leptinotarsa decemlineata TaxID=7539 RepID=UPI003D305C72
MSEEANLKFPLRILKEAGFLKEKTLVDKFKIYISLLCLFIVDSLLIWTLWCDIKTFEDLVTISETAGCYCQATSKLLVLIIFNNDLKDILTSRDHFWEYDKFGKEFGDKLRIIPRIAFSFIKIFIFFVLGVLLAMLLNPILFGILPTKLWVPDGRIWFYTTCVIQSEVHIYSAVASALGFDTLFALIYIEITIQFKLLNRAFSMMENHNDLKKCVEYQVFLYEFIEKLRNVFSVFLLTLCFDCMILVSIKMLVAVDPNQNMVLRVKAILFVIGKNVQLSLFCFPVGFLKDELDRSPDAISSCPWFLKNKNFRNDIIFIMLRSQRTISVRAGGLFEIDRQAFTEVFKFTFSVYTLLSAVQ